MGVHTRKVKNKRNTVGELIGKAGTVYDVDIKYKTGDGYKRYTKKGFSTKLEAQQHEAVMKAKLATPTYTPMTSVQSKQTVKEYLETWVEQHGKANLRPSTFDSYKGFIRNHIVPAIGHIRLRALTPAVLDNLFQKMFDKGLSQSSVRYCQRILSVALEAARKYRYIEHNPARDILTKFGKGGKTPDPYTVQQVQQLMSHVIGSDWEMPILLASLYGLRLSEILGLRWDNVDLEKGTFAVVEQLPYRIAPGTTVLTEMAPVKGKADDGSGERVLPITDAVRPYFLRQLDKQERQRALARASGTPYYDNHIVIAKPNGAPLRRERVSADFGQMLRRLELPHLRFHDLRHSAATNMHELTGDFYTVGMILGHSLKGIGLQLNISTNMDAMTARYVDVRLDRKKAVLDAYHNALHPKSRGGKSRGGNGGNRKESVDKAERKKSPDLDL
jgi:integrase